MKKIIIALILVLVFFTACIQEPTGQATESIQENELNEIQSVPEHKDVNASNKTNWWGLANYLLLFD
jgi:outer membrane lipoprotein-sorting protein